MGLLLSLDRGCLLCRLVLIHNCHDAKQVIWRRRARLDLVWLWNLHSRVVVDRQELLRSVPASAATCIPSVKCLS